MGTSLKLVPRYIKIGDVILGIKVVLLEVAGCHPKFLAFTFIVKFQRTIIWENLASESKAFRCLFHSTLRRLPIVPRVIFFIRLHS